MNYTKLSILFNAHAAVFIALFFSVDQFRWVFALLTTVDLGLSYYFFSHRPCKQGDHACEV